jgi:hypothetical protein
MTTEQLERDLEQLASPRDADDRLRLEVRARLSEQLLAQPQRRRRRGWGFGWAAVAAAVLATLIVALAWSGGSARPSVAEAAIIRHTLQAITAPANAIVHVKEVGVQDGTTVGVEWWQQTGQPHALRLIKGPIGHQREAANDGTTSFQYDPGSNRVIATPAASAPALVDPIQNVRAQLTGGGAHVAGTTTIDGRAVYRIELPTGTVAYFDTTDYRPLYLDNPQRGGSVVRTRVVAYEELPMNSGNARLLSIRAQHPDARISTRSAPIK